MITEPALYILIALGKFLLGSLLVVLSLPLLRRGLHNFTTKTRNSFDDQLICPVLRTAAPLGY
jgi:hypothetical protein